MERGEMQAVLGYEFVRCRRNNLKGRGEKKLMREWEIG
jgi:hypothetical protein